MNLHPEERETSPVTYSDEGSSRSQEHMEQERSAPEQMDTNHFLQMYGISDNHCNICDELTELFDTLDSDHQLGFLVNSQGPGPAPAARTAVQTVSVAVQTSAPAKACRGQGRTLLEQLQQNIPQLQELSQMTSALNVDTCASCHCKLLRKICHL